MKIMSKSFRISRYAPIVVTLIAVVLNFPSFVGLHNAAADETTERSIGILIENATVQQIGQSNSAVLKLKITNLTPDQLSLRTVIFPLARKSSIIMNFQNGKTELVEGLPILEEETLNISSSHLWVKLDDLSRPLEEGERLSFKLLFSDASVSAVADVHLP